LAALAMPRSEADFAWLRKNGVEVLITLTEDPPFRRWVNEAGLMNVHVPVTDMDAPSDEQFDTILETIERAKASGMGVAVHCTAGKGRTGTVLAAYFVVCGMTAREAIEKVRKQRPGSIETPGQEMAVREFADRLSP